MIAPIRELCPPETEEPLLSEAARTAAALLLATGRAENEAPAVPAWQAWLLVAWLIVTSLAYVAITLGLWTN
jgi:hypothetical protein